MGTPLEVHSSHLPHDVQVTLLVCRHFLLCQLDDIVVIGAAHAFVRSDDNIAHLPVFGLDLLPLIEIPHIDVLRCTGKDTPHSIQQLIEIGLCCCQILFRLFQLGGGDQIHGIGDFHNVVDALDPVTDLTHVAHFSSPASYRYAPVPAAFLWIRRKACRFLSFR